MSSVDVGDLPILGGNLCLDFVNTIDPRFGDSRVEYLADYDALVSWAVRLGATTSDQAAILRQAAQAAPLEAQATIVRAHVLREDLYSLLRPVRGSETHRALASFNAAVKRHARHAVIVADGLEYAEGADFDADLDQPLWPVTRSATALMTDARALGRVRECDGLNCGWLFLDTSKAGRRRWCSMGICGNRAKLERHRERNLST
jgi:predicted RNA-binding Zn ribbon-like protein